MSKDFFMVDTPATIDESGGMDLAHPVNKAPCEATVHPRDELERAAVALEVRLPQRRCKRAAKHWTHVVDDTRMSLCLQHFRMVERERRHERGDALVRLWREDTP